MKEIWKDVVWYEWKYQVSNLGNVKSLSYNWTWKEKLLKPYKNIKRSWYMYIIFSKNGIEKSYSLHRIIWFAFIPNPKNKAEINHKNWIKDDNRIENLEWVTHQENEIHKHKNNLQWEYMKRWWIWIYAKNAIWEKHHLSKKVSLYKWNELVWTYWSIRQASIKTNYSQCTILKHLKWIRWNRKSKYTEYKWIYN